MTDSYDHLDAIHEHSEGFAAAAEGNLGASVEHCPGWSVADLVWHLTDVHWFWSTIADERLSAPPDESLRPQRVGDDKLIARFRSGAQRLVEVLERAPDDAAVWTWAPRQRDIAFIVRHQVQEAAVHHWDAEHAAGLSLQLEEPLANDSIDEFLTFSVANDTDLADPAPAALGEPFVLATDGGLAWTIADGSQPGALVVTAGAAPTAAAVRASASDLLLWLYGRVNLEMSRGITPVVERFRAFTFTD